MLEVGSLLRRLLGGSVEHERSAQKLNPRPLPMIETDFRLLAENSNDVILRINGNMAPVYASPSVEHVLGWTVEEMVEGGAGGFIDPRDAAAVAAVHERLVTGEDQASKASFRVLRKDGTPVWVEANARMVRDPTTGAAGDLVIVFRDISDRKRLEDELLALSFTDSLTGLANRRAFDDALTREWQRTAREGSHMSLLLLDIDHFKRFNDLYGHQAGDDCLRVVASAIKSAVQRPGDIAARYGGEEIGIILPNTEARGAEVIAENVRSAIEALAVHHAGNCNEARVVTASIGVATTFARPGGTMKMPEGLLLAADGALYKAKQSGRNRVSATVLLAARAGAHLEF